MGTHDDRPGNHAGGTGTTSNNRPQDSSDLREQLSGAADDAKSMAKDQGEHYRDAAAENVDAMADSARAAADQLDHGGLGGELSDHITDLADGMSRFSAGLRDKSADEMIRDLRETARNHPAMFLAGSVALGFGISRFARASSRPETPDSRSSTRGQSAASATANARPATAGNTGAMNRGATSATTTTPAGQILPDSRPDAPLGAKQTSTNDAAHAHPLPPYGAPSKEDQRHD